MREARRAVEFGKTVFENADGFGDIVITEGLALRVLGVEGLELSVLLQRVILRFSSSVFLTFFAIGLRKRMA